jgi:hypothetical protein
VICEERQRLLVEYRDSARRYSEVVCRLVETVGLELNTDIELLRRKCRAASTAVEQARLALHRHEADHFCDRPDFLLEWPQHG